MKGATFFQKIEKLSAQLRTSSGRGVYLIEGHDELLRNEAVSRFASAYLSESEKEFAFEPIDAQEIAPYQLAEMIGSPSLFGNRRFIWLKNFTETKEFAAVLMQPVMSETVVMVTAGKYDRRKSLFSKFSKEGNFFELQAGDGKYGKKGSAHIEMIKMMCEESGKKIEHNACLRMVENAATQTALLKQELEKMICCSGPRNGTITLDDVVSVGSFVQPDTPGYILADFVGNKDLYHSLRAVKEILLRDDDYLVLGLLSALAGRFRLLLQAYELNSSGLLPFRGMPANYNSYAMMNYIGKAADAAMELLPEEKKHNVLKQHAYRIYIIFNQCKKHTGRELVEGFNEIVSVFHGLVTTQKDKRMAVEHLIIRLCGKS